MKQVLWALFGVAVFITAVGFLTQRLQNNKVQSKEISIGSVKIQVEIANSESLRQKGLGGRKSLAENSGMLFVFDQKDIFPGFWMKDMLISIDIIWINDGTVAKIDKNIEPPAPGTVDSQLKLYRPDTPIDYVLEVRAGFSDKNSIGIGDSVDLSAI